MNPFLSFFLPHPEGEHRSPVIHRPALAVYVFFLLIFYLFLNFSKSVAPGVLGFASNIFTDQIVDFTNRYRQEKSLPPLKVDPVLSEAARRKAEDMFADGYWAHVAPDGAKPWDFILSSGYEYVYAGENLAKDFQDSEKVVVAWMDSPSHRQNLLNEHYQDIGVAVVNGALNGYETTLVVQMFGQRMPPLAAVPKTKPVEGAKVATGGAGGGWVLSAPSQPKVDVFTLTRGLSLSLGALVLGFFALDAFTARRRGLVRISGHTWAHLTLLLFLLVVVYLVKPGAIL